MRMMRDQGGPPPFEPTAGPHPRKAGRGGGPPMGGPSPIFNAPPLLHDPRRIRRLMLISQSLCSLHICSQKVHTINVNISFSF